MDGHVERNQRRAGRDRRGVADRRHARLPGEGAAGRPRPLTRLVLGVAGRPGGRVITKGRRGGPGGSCRGAGGPALRGRAPRLWLSRSWTTRPPRPDEPDDWYHFVDA